MIFFISFWNNPTEAAKKAVTAPVTIIIAKANSDCSSNGEHLINKYTPAVTIVAACIKAETGVGYFIKIKFFDFLFNFYMDSPINYLYRPKITLPPLWSNEKEIK
jgi:hypothetical protein